MSAQTLAPLLAAIRAAFDWLGAGGVDAAVVGGVAASIHGRPRVTKDVDLVALTDEDGCEALLASAIRFDIVPRHDDVLEFARTTKVLLMRHDPSGIELDVSLGGLPFERQLVESATRVCVADVEMRVALPEDVIIMKALALRPRDVADIEGMVEAQPKLDLDRVRKQVEEFSAVLEEEDLLSELDRILRKLRREPSR